MGRQAGGVRNRTRTKRLVASDYGYIAKLWDRYWVPAHASIRERLVEVAHPQPGEWMLDVGTGTGATALLVAPRVGPTGAVLGIDNARQMLVVAQRKAARLGLGHLEFRVMDTAVLELPDASYDVVISSFGMPELPSDTHPALIQLRRVLKPHGRLCFCEFAAKRKPMTIFEGVFAKYKVANPGPALAARRRAEALVEQERERFPALYWSGAPTVKTAVEDAGFHKVTVFTESFAVTFPSAPALVEFMLAEKRAEYEAMTGEARLQCRRELLHALQGLDARGQPRWTARVNFCVGRR